MRLIALCTVLSGGGVCTDLAEFACTKPEFLRGFLKEAARGANISYGIGDSTL
jgi:hypothetical protein